MHELSQVEELYFSYQNPWVVFETAIGILWLALILAVGLSTIRNEGMNVVGYVISGVVMLFWLFLSVRYLITIIARLEVDARGLHVRYSLRPGQLIRWQEIYQVSVTGPVRKSCMIKYGDHWYQTLTINLGTPANQRRADLMPIVPALVRAAKLYPHPHARSSDITYNRVRS